MNMSVRSIAGCLASALVAGFVAEIPVKAESPEPSAATWYADYVRDSRPVTLPDGRTLNLYCVGSGSPTVILESGISESAFTWWAVQQKIAKSTRTCAYDRAGLGLSPPGPLPRDIRAEVQDLEQLLREAKVLPPYILVGHSMGAMNMRLFAGRHPDDVAGLVLVDPSVEGQLPLLEGAVPAIAANDHHQLAGLRACADQSRSSETAKKCARNAPDGFPPDLAAAYEATFGLTFFQTVLSEAESFVNVNSGHLTAEAISLNSMPLIVLTRGALSSDLPKDQAELEWKLWNGLHDKVTSLSGAGKHRVIDGSGHYIQLDRPDAVVEAVESVFDGVRMTPSGSL